MSRPQQRTDELVDELRGRYPGRVSTTPPDRQAYARDLWPRGLLGVAAGDPAPHPPDAVVWPTSVEEVQQVVSACAARGVPIVPYGGGSGVCGGAVPLHGGITIDTKRMQRLVSLDGEAGCATFEAGLVGERFERELDRRGYTFGHFPSSIICSTVGGWLATRAAGQLSTKYGKVEDIVRRLTVVTGRARCTSLEQRRRARTGAADRRQRGHARRDHLGRLRVRPRRSARLPRLRGSRASPPASRRSAACCSAACAPRWSGSTTSSTRS